MLWTDETKVNLVGSDGKHWVRRPKSAELHPNYTLKTFKHGGGSIMVWGCFSWHGVGPLFWIKETMDRFLYVRILEETMLPYAEWEMPLKWQFQQDNDPKHTSILARTWLTAKKIDSMIWPSQSPDLNPIENLWRIVKEKIGGVRSTSKDNLWENIQRAWYSIPQTTCASLVDSMPRRCQAVLRNKGYFTKY